MEEMEVICTVHLMHNDVPVAVLLRATEPGDDQHPYFELWNTDRTEALLGITSPVVFFDLIEDGEKVGEFVNAEIIAGDRVIGTVIRENQGQFALDNDGKPIFKVQGFDMTTFNDDLPFAALAGAMYLLRMKRFDKAILRNAPAV